MNHNQQLLKRIDDEITGHRQQIAAHQVHIARLEDTRRVLQGLAEADMEAKTVAGTTPALERGQNGKPVLIVRKMTEDAPPAAVKKTKRKRDNSKRAGWRKRLGEFFQDPTAEPMKAAELANYFGLAPGSKNVERKDLANALYYMAKAGTLQQDGEGRYFAPTRQ